MLEQNKTVKNTLSTGSYTHGHTHRDLQFPETIENVIETVLPTYWNIIQTLFLILSLLLV